MNQIDRLLTIMQRLRDPENGCPWDKEQTFATIAPYTLEETYEVLDAIAREDFDDLRGELGDLLGHGEAEQGGAEKNSILCDIVESLIGATFLEHGIDEARKVIHRLIDDTLAEVATEGPALDWKTSLTVKAHGLGKEEPVYHMEVSGPEYAQIFTARVSLGENGDIIGIGKGSSKRKAQLAAAEAGWKSLDSFKTRTK